ncbi:hypothetical protein BDW69DRAFT_168839 [Aspergillus filifer]
MHLIYQTSERFPQLSRLATPTPEKSTPHCINHCIYRKRESLEDRDPIDDGIRF